MTILKTKFFGIDETLMAETELVYFITLCHESQFYRLQLEKDHELAEIHSQMLCAKNMIATKARIAMYDDVFDGNLCFRKFDKHKQSKMLFEAIEYQRSADEKLNIEKYINAFIKYYGMPETISEVALKAAIRNDNKLVNILKKYITL